LTSRGRQCADIKNRKYTIQKIQEIAKAKGGKCLSDEYINNHTDLQWQCKKGHIWKTTPHNIIKGRWCAKCAGTAKLTIEQMQEIAKIRGGKCLSEKYINGKTKLLWQCSEGHSWWATPSKVKNDDTWCPECYYESLRKPRLKKRRKKSPVWL